jgi:hypothetical protein
VWKTAYSRARSNSAINFEGLMFRAAASLKMVVMVGWFWQRHWVLCVSGVWLYPHGSRQKRSAANATSGQQVRVLSPRTVSEPLPDRYPTVC